MLLLFSMSSADRNLLISEGFSCLFRFASLKDVLVTSVSRVVHLLRNGMQGCGD